MSENKINKNIRYYLPNDPYYFEVDNLPIKDLIENDDRLQIQVDQLKSQFDVVQGRGTFGELKPFADAGNPGRIFVNPGNFMARVDSGSDRYTGLEETGDNSFQSYPNDWVDTVSPEVNNAQSIAKGTARTALVRLHKNLDGTIPSIAISEGFIGDYPVDENSSPPAYRLDLVFVKGTKAEDQDGGDQTGATLGIIRGAYFIKGNPTADGRSGTGLTRDDKTMIQNVNDVSPDVIQMKINPADGRPLYTTIPTPDLTIHHNANAAPISLGNGTFMNKDDLALYLDANENANMGCPVAYVLVPFNYQAGSPIPADNIIDVRPFFRTNELTLPERQAIATADNPNILNPLMTSRSVDKRFAFDVARTPSMPDIQTQVQDLSDLVVTALQNTFVQRKYMFGDGTISGGSVFFSGRKTGWNTYYLGVYPLTSVPANAKFITVTFNGQNDHNNAYNYYRRTGVAHDADNICFYLRGDGEPGPGGFNTNSMDIPCEGGSFQLYFAGFNGHYAAYCNGYIIEEPILPSILP